jgi:hypothetical protein
MEKNKDYIVITELPIEQQKPLNDWLYGQSAPIIEKEGINKYNCCFKWDYDTWYAAWIQGNGAVVTD